MVLYNIASAKDSSSWEEAASITVNELFSYISENENLLSDITRRVILGDKTFGNNFVGNMRMIVDYMIDNKIWNHEETTSFDVNKGIVNCWCALSLMSFLSMKSIDKNLETSVYQDTILLTVTRKQRDYGAENIAKFGLNGLVIRIHDKVARLENLIKKGTDPSNESVQDTLLDIIGYSVIAIKWINKTFLLPMSNTDDFMPKALTEDEIFYSIEESPINRHSRVPVTGTTPVNTKYTIFDSRGVKISENSYTYPNPKHPNPKFR